MPSLKIQGCCQSYDFRGLRMGTDVLKDKEPKHFGPPYEFPSPLGERVIDNGCRAVSFLDLLLSPKKLLIFSFQVPQSWVPSNRPHL